MHITKEYEVVLNLTPKEIYQKKHDIIKAKLIDLYEGKCEKNTLIVKILSINYISSIYISKTRINGEADVNVKFTADAVIHEPEEILVGCKYITTLDSGQILFDYPTAYINMGKSPNITNIKVNQLLTLKIRNVSYVKNDSKITVIAEPYSYSFNFIIYKPIWKQTDQDIINTKLDLIKTEKQRKINQNLFNFFDDIYYMYKNIVVNKPESVKTLNFTEIEKIKEKDIYLIRHPYIKKSKPECFYILQQDFVKGIKGNLFIDKLAYSIIELPIDLIIINMLNDYYNYIKMLNDMSEIYKESEIDNYSNIWNMYNNMTDIVTKRINF